MSDSELLSRCRNYFKQAQDTWDSYFTKWEEMANNENWEESDKEDMPQKIKNLSKRCKKDSCHRNKANTTLNNNRKYKKKCKSNQESYVKLERNDITRDLSNSKSNCETTPEDKHLEIDLKKIFMEIMSETEHNTKMVFSVLSRTLSTTATENEMGNLSRGSVTMKKTEVSMVRGGMRTTTTKTTSTVLQSGSGELCSPEYALAACRRLERPVLRLESPKQWTDHGRIAVRRPGICGTPSPSPLLREGRTSSGRSPLRTPEATLSAAFPLAPLPLSARSTTPTSGRGKKRKSLRRMSDLFSDDDSSDSDEDGGNSPIKCPKISCTPKRLPCRGNKKLRGEDETTKGD